MQLSCDSQKLVREKVDSFIEKEKKVNLFPWDYDTDMEI